MPHSARRCRTANDDAGCTIRRSPIHHPHEGNRRPNALLRRLAGLADPAEGRLAVDPGTNAVAAARRVGAAGDEGQ